MRDIPIIFSAPMVRALLDGRKTMTRRLAWGKPFAASDDAVPINRGWGDVGSGYWCKPSPWQKVKPGDRLWVRENWRANRISPDFTIYSADVHPGERDGPWRPSIHMPRIRSRLTLVVTATKVERLQEISEVDERAEGCRRLSHDVPVMFRDLWISLHGLHSWHANPEVVALSFTVHRCNIDQLQPEGHSNDSKAGALSAAG